MSELIDALREIMATVRLRLEETDGAFAVGYESETHPLAELPLDGTDPAAERAELFAVAAGFESAVKYPASPGPDVSFREDATHLLPRVERARFLDAYRAVLRGAGIGPERFPYARDFGAGLTVIYGLDEGWMSTAVSEARVAAWGVSPGTIESAARSALYDRMPVHGGAREAKFGDGYDASRAVIAGDLFYHRVGGDGLLLGLPGRDHLMVGSDLTADAVAEAYAAARFPLCPHLLVYKDGLVKEALVDQTR